MADFEYIDLGFENCDYVHILSGMVESLNLSDVTDWILTNGSQQLIEMKTCKDFEIELKNESLSIHTRFQDADDDGDTFQKHLTVYRDITNINICVNKFKNIDVGIPWESEDEHDLNNKLLKVEFNDKTFTISAQANPS
jgi:hypothetical protein